MGFDPKSRSGGKGKRGRSTDADTLAEAFADSEAGEDRELMFDAGKTYRCAFVGAEQKPAIAGKKEWVVARFKGAGKDKKIGERAALFCVSSNALPQAMKRLKPLIMALVGCDDLDEYNAFDPEGKLFSAVLGKKNAMSKRAAKLIGTEIDVRVTRGNETEDGDYYRNVSFKIASDDDSDDADEESDEDADEEEDERPAKRRGRR